MSKELYGILLQGAIPTPNKPQKIENLIVNKEAKELIEKQSKEIERLNNIINELEKWLKECKDMCANYTFDETYECEYNFYQQIAIADFIKSFILNKLQELKGSDKE